jgi:hypothetical protein
MWMDARKFKLLAWRLARNPLKSIVSLMASLGLVLIPCSLGPPHELGSLC